MNTSASTLLQTLSTVGVRSVSFRLLSQHDVHKHTTPVVVLDEDEGSAHKMPRFSIADLFAAYSLMPRKGYYTLEVERGQLSYTPPPPRAAVKSDHSADVGAAQTRWTPKIAQRHQRSKPRRARKFPSA